MICSMSNTLQIIKAEIIGESEKAIQAKVWFGDEYTRNIWFPKSQAEITPEGKLAISDWIWEKKDVEFGRSGCWIQPG